MSDYRTEQSAAAFWRQIDARIEAALASHRKRQSGIAPDVAYGSVKFNAAGEAIWGGVGGSSPVEFVERGAAGISVTSGGTYTVFEFDQDTLGWWDAGDPTMVTLPFTGAAFVVARMFWVPATPKDGNRSIEINQDRGGINIDSWSVSYRAQDTGLASGFDITHWPFWFVDVQAGDKLWGQVAQTNSGGASIPAHLALWIRAM